MNLQLRRKEREARFYREILERIATDRRNTMARRLASSGLAFWDQLQVEVQKRRKR